MSEATLKLSPSWRQAERDFIAAGFTFDSVVPTRWFREAFDCAAPAKSIAEHERRELQYMHNVQKLRDALLENHHMMLRPIRGVGYAVVAPRDQTRVAMADRTAEVDRALHKLGREISFVDTSRLTDDERKQNADALAKLGSLQSVFAKRLARP